MNRRLLFSLPIFLFPLNAAALEEDRDSPLQVNAASVTMDQKSGTTMYRGNVVLMQGSLRVEADLIEVRARNFKVDTVTATGRPVKLRALLDDRHDELRASAERVVLNVPAREIDLEGSVSLHQGGNQFTARRLHYALDDRHMTATGTDGEHGRVYAIIQAPQKQTP